MMGDRRGRARGGLAGQGQGGGGAGAGVVRLIAHRGTGHERNDPLAPPENTLAAVRHGFDAGADAVEVDVWRIRDGAVVLHHDRTTDRTTDLPGRFITDLDSADLRSVSAGGWKDARWSGERIPELGAAAAAVPEGRGLIVEIEEGPQVVEAVVAELAASGLSADQVMFISFNLDSAAEAKRCAPRHRVLWIVDTLPRWQIGGWAQGHRRGRMSRRAGYDRLADTDWIVEQLRRHHLDGLDTLFAYPPDLPARLADEGLLWSVWTANDRRAIDACIADGAWGITTDLTADAARWFGDAGVRTAGQAGLAF